MYGVDFDGWLTWAKAHLASFACLLTSAPSSRGSYTCTYKYLCTWLTWAHRTQPLRRPPIAPVVCLERCCMDVYCITFSENGTKLVPKGRRDDQDYEVARPAGLSSHASCAAFRYLAPAGASKEADARDRQNLLLFDSPLGALP